MQKITTRDNLMQSVSDFTENQNQPRKHFDEVALSELKASVKEFGVLQPILYTITEDKKKVIVAGERRWRVSKELLLEKIPAIFIENAEKIDDIALVENLFRSDLTAIEEAEALENLKTKYNFTTEKLSTYLGRARSSVTESLTLNKLPEPIKEQCRNIQNLPKTKLIKIARMKSPEKQVAYFNKLVNPKATKESTAPKSSQDTYSFINTFSKSLSKRLDGKLKMNEEQKENLQKSLSQLMTSISAFIEKNKLNI